MPLNPCPEPVHISRLRHLRFAGLIVSISLGFGHSGVIVKKMVTLQAAAAGLRKELLSHLSSDAGVIQAAQCLEWASRRKNPRAARLDIKDARNCVSPPRTPEQVLAKAWIVALTQPAIQEKEWGYGGDRCAICGEDAARCFKPHHSRSLIAVCARHAQPHLRAQDLTMIHKAMADPDPVLLDVLERESAVYLRLEYLVDVGEIVATDWAGQVRAWWQKVSESEGVIEAWQRLVAAAPDSSYHPNPAARDEANALALCRFAFHTIQKQSAEADKRASQQNGRKGGRPPTATAAQARQVRRLVAKGVPQVKIAEQVGLSRSHVVRLLKSFK